ncbi:MAG: DUF1631 domain-containing protein, partial [Gammaproteobacteria bacterium]
ERNMYFEAMREIRLKRDGVKKHFDYEMQKCFDSFIRGNADDADLDDEDELTLVELDDLEDNIAIENMISRARPKFEDDLFAVTERLKAVLRRKKIDEEDNPLDPKAICDSFHAASELLDTDIQVKLIFYKLFEKYVMNNLGHFYQEVNELFIKKGVLPGFKVDQERMKQTTRFMANRIKNNPAPAAGPVASMLAPAGVPGGGVAATDGNLFATLQQAIGGLAATGFTPSGGSTVSGSGAGVGSGLASGPAGGIVAAERGANFVAALSTLQADSIPTQPLSSIDPQSLKAQTQQQLVAFREANQHQVNSADNQTIDVVSMLFDFFFDDEALPAPIKVLIGRLQIPILKVAIIDKEFFNQKKHPARKLLDSISRASLGWSDSRDDHQPLIDKTEEVVNFLISEFEEDVSVFEEAYINFENFVNAEHAEIEKTDAALRQQEKAKDQQIQTAQDAAAALLHKLTNKRELSFEVTDFLDTIWSSVLFNAYLSLGEDSNHWRNLKRISTTFVWTLIPKHTEEERSKIIKTIPALLRALSKGMDLVKINTDVQNRIFQMLAQEHAKIVKQTSKNIVTRVDDQTVWPEDAGAAALARAESLKPGAKPDFDFSADHTGDIEVFEEDVSDDSITLIDATDTSDVIEDLNQFATGVKEGKITVDEEIVLGSDEEDDFDLIMEGGDDSLEQAQALEIGSWVEFTDDKDQVTVARLSWRSNVTGNFVFVNRQGHKIRNMTINGFAMELRSGRARCIESSSVFDRAIFSIVSKMQH